MLANPFGDFVRLNVLKSWRGKDEKVIIADASSKETIQEMHAELIDAANELHALLDEPECVCGETSARNCPAHGGKDELA